MRTASALAAAALSILVCSFDVAAQGPPPPPVIVATPLKRVVPEWDEFTGRFEASQSVEVRARVGGFIDRISFRDGQTVRPGDELFVIDARPYQTAVDAGRADVARAQAQVELASQEVDRATPLLQNRTMTQREFETRQSNLRVAQASLQSAQASLRSAELNLEWTTVRAPIAGRISYRRVDEGNLVAGGNAAGTPTLLTTIVATDPIYFVFDASEADFLRYARAFATSNRPQGRDNGSLVQVRLQGEQNWTREGRLNFVDNALNARSGTIRSRALFHNPDGLLTPGLFGRLRLWVGDAEVLLVPDAAIVADQARRIVLVVGPDNVVAPRPLELGPIVDGLRVVRSGLAETDRVIINGIANPFVRPGARVTPQDGTISPPQASGQTARN
jgi:multidrug efflux system membrane fusion protein